MISVFFNLINVKILRGFKYLFVLMVLSNCKEDVLNITPTTRFEWKQSQDIDNNVTEKRDSLIYKIERGDYGFIDEVFISKSDTIVYNTKFNLNYNEISKGIKGKMGCGSNMCLDSSEINIYNYYHPKYHPYYNNSKAHTLQSVTKSIVSTIIGTAIQKGEIKSVNESVYQYFREYTLSTSMQKHLTVTTIKDVLTMQLGLEWSEFGKSLEEDTSVSEMELSDNWISYVLKQSIKSQPGKEWNYNSGASQLLSKIIEGSTQKTIDEYAQEILFEKLNIKEYYWKKTPSGLPDTEGGLYLISEDLAKIALLHLNDGVWNGERLLPENWVQEALGKQVSDIYQDGGKEGYGYQWWITGDEPSLTVGLGYGNQILVIIPEKNVIGVIYAWNVFDNKAKYIFRDFVDVLMHYNLDITK